jgi:hypothetical protein
MRKTAGRMTVEVVRELTVSYDYSRRTEVRGRVGNKSGPCLAQGVTTTQDCGFCPVSGPKIRAASHPVGMIGLPATGPLTADILTPESWSKWHPIPHGNIFDDDYGIGGYTVHGPTYIPCRLSGDGV